MLAPATPEEAMPDRSTIRYTYQDYLAIPEEPGRRYEIVDGELVVTPMPRSRHGDPKVVPSAHVASPAGGLMWHVDRGVIDRGRGSCGR